MEKLIVSNFLNIKHIELELGKINILIGPQAQGKSIIAKLVFFFSKFWVYYKNSIKLLQTKIEFDKVLNNEFEHIFPEYTWKNQEFKIIYSIKSYRIILNNTLGEKNLNIICSDDLMTTEEEKSSAFDELISKIDIHFLKTTEKLIEDSDLLNYLNSKSILKIQERFEFNKTSIFIPSGRSFFSFLKENIFTLVDNFKFEYFMKAFGSIYNISDTKYEYQNRHQKDNYDSMIDILTERILKGKYTYEQEIDFISSEDGRKTRLMDASSGQQEALPIIILLTVFSLNENTCDFIIEEPEAHLFPAAQNDIVNLMSLIFNITEKRHSFFITTHSPYILTAFNTLIQAGNTYKKIIAENREYQLPELFKIVPENQMLDIKEIRVYSLENGKIENIIEEEFQVIDANIIDDISNFTGEQLDKLLDLKYSHE